MLFKAVNSFLITLQLTKLGKPLNHACELLP
jgi:hypothetical protein